MVVFTIAFREQEKGLKNNQEAKKEVGRSNKNKVDRKIKEAAVV